MSLLTNHLIREIYEAEQRAMQALTEAWDREIAAHQCALVEINREKRQEQAGEAAMAQAVAVYLEGIVEQAMGGDEKTIAIPTGISVASPIVGGPSISAINTLISQATTADDLVDDPAQKSAAWALGNGFVPHPADLARILDRIGIDAPWKKALEQLGTELDALGPQPAKNPILQAYRGGKELDVVAREVALIKAFTPERTLSLVVDPVSLADTSAGPLQLPKSTKQQTLDALLDTWIT